MLFIQASGQKAEYQVNWTSCVNFIVFFLIYDHFHSYGSVWYISADTLSITFGDCVIGGKATTI